MSSREVSRQGTTTSVRASAGTPSAYSKPTSLVGDLKAVTRVLYSPLAASLAGRPASSASSVAAAGCTPAALSISTAVATPASVRSSTGSAIDSQPSRRHARAARVPGGTLAPIAASKASRPAPISQ